MKPLPADNSRCEKCKKGIIHWHAGGATCDWCGRTWYGKGVTEFHKLPNGSIFITPDYYPASTHYEHKELIYVKAERESDFPKGRKNRINNCYEFGHPDRQGACGPDCTVVHVQVVKNLR